LFAAGAAVFILCWSANAALLDPAQIDAARLLPPPPMAGSADARAEIAELHAIAARATPAMLDAAKHDSKDEKPDMFNAALGFDVTALPATTRLLNEIIEEEDAASKAAKKYFHRDRPWMVDSTIHTCSAHKKGPAANSYPSGHATLAFAMAEVLAVLMPQKAQAILLRASDFAESRLTCGVHFRSDIVAGQQFGTIIALKLMQDSRFAGDMAGAQDELRAHHF
jgi:acid phosphatase (class A)